MVNNKITLNFEIEKGELIDKYYFSAHIKLTNESKNLLRERLGNAIQFDNLDNYFNLSPEDFYIYHNKYNGYDGRDELYIKSKDGSYFTHNLPLNRYGFSVELPSDGSSIIDYGFYPLHAMYNPNSYNKAKEKAFDDSNELLPTTLNVLESLLSNTEDLTIKDMFLQLQNELTEREARTAREKRQVEEELTRNNEELKELIEKDKVVLFKVVKGEAIDNKHAVVILQLSKGGINKDITLDSQKYYIAEYKGEEFLHCVGSHDVMLLNYDYLLFVLNKSSYHNLESGFYPIRNFDNFYSDLNTSNYHFKDNQLSEKLDSNLKINNNYNQDLNVQNFYDEQSTQELSVESRNKSREKRLAEDENYIEDQSTLQDSHIHFNKPEEFIKSKIIDNIKTVELSDDSKSKNTSMLNSSKSDKIQGNKIEEKLSTNEYSNQEKINRHEEQPDTKICAKVEELVQKLFPNKENIVINDNLVVEVRYGGMTSYTSDYIKQTVQKSYEAWCENFYPQKNNNDDTVKIQLHVFKNYDDYKKYIKEVSGEEYTKLWGGGTIRAHETDGTIAKTYIIGDVQGLFCAKSRCLMEKMSDAFLEYATGNINEIPEALRIGMRLFMWSYDADRKESSYDVHYMKEAYDKMQTHNIVSMTNDYRVADCLVKFLQEKNPSLISKLISEMRSNKVDIKAELAQSLNKPEIEREFKQWMDAASGNKIITELVPNSDAMLFAEHNIKINIKYDARELDYDKLSNVKNTIKSSVEDFNSTFSINNSQLWNNIPNQVNVFIFNTKDDYKNYLKVLNVYDEDNVGLTSQGRGSNIHVHLYLQDQFNNSCKTLRHELGHALTIIDSYYGAGNVLPIAMHEGIANYIAGLENGKHINDHGDIEALYVIKNKGLKPDEILHNNHRGERYYSEAEQVIKFLEYKHPDLLDELIKTLSKHSTSGPEGNKFIEAFMQNLKSYNLEFTEWVAEQIEDNNSTHAQADSSAIKPHSTNVQYRAKEDEQEIIASVIDSMDSSDKVDNSDDVAVNTAQQHPLKIKTGNLCKIITPASSCDEKPIILPEAYAANNHLFIQNEDLGTLNDFNKMFYKSDDLLG